MTGAKRKALLAGVMSMAGVVAAVPMVMSGTANAQTNSRLCGRIYHTTPGSRDPNDIFDLKETVIALYEVAKGDPASICSQAAKRDFKTVFDVQDNKKKFTLVQQNKRFWDDGDGFEHVKCEEWRFQTLGDPGLRPLKFMGSGWSTMDQLDICNNINRSDNALDMDQYWLHNVGDTGEWEFYNGNHLGILRPDS